MTFLGFPDLRAPLSSPEGNVSILRNEHTHITFFPVLELAISLGEYLGFWVPSVYPFGQHCL